MKIGIEVQRLFRKKKFGIESSALEMIKSLVKANTGNDYVIFAKDDEDRQCLEQWDNVTIRTIGGNFFADFEQFFLPLASRREQVDLLHCTGNTAPYFSPVPVIQTLHDVIFMDEIPATDTPYQRFGNHYRRQVVPLITPRSKAVITVSQYEKDRIVKRLGVNPDRIHVVYNGINDQRFHSRRSIAAENFVKIKYQLPDEYILFLGNQSCRKNPVSVLEAYVKYATSTDNPLPLVTPGLSQQFISEKLAGLNHPFDHSLFYTPGYIHDADLPDIYRASTLFLFPSLAEGFGMPIVEAMACGTPVITSNVSCMPEIAGNAGLLINPLDTTAMASAISGITENADLHRELSALGIVNARRFSWAQSAKKILGLYEAVAEQAKSARETILARQLFAPKN